MMDYQRKDVGEALCSLGITGGPHRRRHWRVTVYESGVSVVELFECCECYATVPEVDDEGMCQDCHTEWM